MVLERHADRLRRALAREDRGATPREIEARHHVRDVHERIAVDLADAGGTIGRVGNRDERIRVRVIDEFVRQQRMQDGLDRRRGRTSAQRVREQLVAHLRVRHRRQRRQSLHVVERQRRKPRLLDRLQIPATALHVNHVFLVTEEIARAHLHRRIAATVEHQ